RHSGQIVPRQAGVDLPGEVVVAAHETGEEARRACELTVAGRAGKEMVDGVDDLVLAATARPAAPSRGHCEAREYERLGKRDQELVVVDPARPVEDGRRGGVRKR